MSAAEKVFRHGPLGVPAYAHCSICGDRFRQPNHGRPRILCRKARCEQARHNERRRTYERKGPRWTDTDSAEALQVWLGRCGYCERKAVEVWVRHDGPVPVCDSHAEYGGTSDAVDRWLSRCKPGCPLPNPFAGATP